MYKEELDGIIKNAKEVISKLTVEELRKSADIILNEKSGCYIWYLEKFVDGYDYALVMGWQDGFEEDDFTDGNNDKYAINDFRICLKFARQSSDSCMQCDYDIDWEYPYDKDSGDCVVFDFVVRDDNFEQNLNFIRESVADFFYQTFPNIK